MKKFLKSRIFVAIITGVVCITGTAYAATKYYAKDVSYTPKDTSWKVDNVEDAINDLYTTANTKISGLNSQISTLQAKLENITGVGAYGDFTTTDSTTIHTIPVGFKPTKIIIYLPLSTTNASAFYIYDSAIANNNVLWAVASNNGGRITYDLATSLSLNIGDNYFTYKPDNNTTIGKTYWYAIK